MTTEYSFEHLEEGTSFQRGGPRHVYTAGGVFNRNSLVTGINSRGKRRIPTQTENSIAQLKRALQGYNDIPGDLAKSWEAEFSNMPQLRTMNMKLLAFTLYTIHLLNNNITPDGIERVLNKYEKVLSYPQSMNPDYRAEARLKYRQEVLMYIKAVRNHRRDPRPLVPVGIEVSTEPIRPSFPPLRLPLPTPSPRTIPPRSPVVPLRTVSLGSPVRGTTTRGRGRGQGRGQGRGRGRGATPVRVPQGPPPPPPRSFVPSTSTV